MMYNKKTVKDIGVSGKRVLVRCDFNVPQDDSGAITDDLRIVGSLPTIQYLLEQGARVILCSHLGRPKGKFDPKYSLAPVAARLTELLGMPVALAADIIGEDAKAKASALRDGQAMLLENVRFHAEEEENDPGFSKTLASLAEVYVNDAFGTAHRAHASTAGVAAFLPAVCGFLIQKELDIIGKALADPKRPLVAILGGAKVSDKIGVISNLIELVDTLVIGGAMAYTFIKCLGGSIGKSRFEPDKVEFASMLLEKAMENGVRVMMPIETVVASEFSPDAEPVIVRSRSIPDDMMGLDIGPATVEVYKRAIEGAGTILWNGTMGVSEFEKFANGTKAVAQMVADSGAITVIGGGDTAAAMQQFGFADKMTHISTGGGASLEFMEGLELPGIACLLDR